MSKFAIFALIAVPSIFIFLKWAYKYRNPYKLYFIFGKKGCGKSSYLCKLALNYRSKGWIVYTNVADLNISGVRIIDDASMIGDFVPEANSVLLLDEVSLTWDNRNFKSFKDSTKEFFRLQRHYRVVCYLFSQTFDVDKKIRDLADSMYLVTQCLGRWSLLREIDKSIVLTESTADAESRIAENLSFRGILSWRFTYLPKYQQYFNSFELPVRPAIGYSEVSDSDDDSNVSPKKFRLKMPKLVPFKRMAQRRHTRSNRIVESRKKRDIIGIKQNIKNNCNLSDSEYSDLSDFWRS